MELEETFQELSFGMWEIKLGEELQKVMKKVVLVVFGMTHINGEKN
jgi:hypothetical protein